MVAHHDGVLGIYKAGARMYRDGKETERESSFHHPWSGWNDWPTASAYKKVLCGFAKSKWTRAVRIPSPVLRDSRN